MGSEKYSKGENMSENGKGSVQRPTDKDKYDSNYDRIFGNKENERIIKNARQLGKTESNIEMIKSRYPDIDWKKLDEVLLKKSINSLGIEPKYLNPDNWMCIHTKGSASFCSCDEFGENYEKRHGNS
jgi:hypothetical protein